MPHANSWRTCGEPPLDNPAYAEEVDPTPREEDLEQDLDRSKQAGTRLIGEIRLLQERLKNKQYTLGYLERRCELLQGDVDELRRDRDRWRELAVKGG